jgi:hypothetical protein
VEDPRDPRRLTLAATYGLLTTADRGATWYHICEASFAGSDSYVGDPLFDLAADGSALVDVQTALNVSRDQGCAWSTVLGSPTDSVPDFAVNRQASSNILALHSVLGDGSVIVHLSESTDNGATFATVGTAVPVFAAFTVDVAPSAPDTVYVSGTSPAGAGRLAVSIDHGATWIARDLPSSAFNEAPYIAAIHPSDPMKIYVRTDTRDTSAGGAQAEDALLYSEDGGKTWIELYRTGAKLLGFALSPDASMVLLGYGDPRDPEVLVDDSVTGIYAGAAASSAFSRVVSGSISCLSWTKTGIYVCTPEAETGRTLGFAADSSFAPDGSSLQPLLRLADIAGPLCCSEPGGQVCAASWPTNCAAFGGCRDAGGSAAPACPNDGGATAPVEAGPSAPDQRAPGGGCGCRAAGAASPSPAGTGLGRLLIALTVLGAIRFARARKRG